MSVNNSYTLNYYLKTEKNSLMKNLIHIIALLVLSVFCGFTLKAQQCDSLYESTISETFSEMEGVITGEFSVTYRQTVDGVNNSVNVSITGDPGVLFEVQGELVPEVLTSTNFAASTTMVPYEYSCPDGTFPLEGLNVYVKFATFTCDTLTITHPLATESSCRDDEEVTSTGDERQVGNTIQELGDGRVSALNAAGNVIAFSSAGGYYICELIDNVWIPIGGEIMTAVPVAQLFVSDDGSSVFVNLTEGFTPQCSYRNGNEFDTNTLEDPNRESRVSWIWDVTGSGSYILFQTVLSEDGENTIGTSCGNLGSGGTIETQLNVNNATGIFGGTVSRGFLSDDGQSFCVADVEFNRTALYTVEGEEISTFDGQVVSASGDLANCLILTSTTSGYIGVWDGGSTFTTSDPFDVTATASYNFGSNGGICVGLTTTGQIYITTITTEGSEVMVFSEFFTIEEVPSFRSVNVNGDGNRFSGSGGDGGDNPDLFVFEFSTSMMPSDDTDTDMDGVPDTDDADDDNDGITDLEECPSATDYSLIDPFAGASSFDILTSQGDVISFSAGGMSYRDQRADDNLPSDFQLTEGDGLENTFEIAFPYDVINLYITTNDYDVDAFDDPIEWMDNFSVMPTRVEGQGVIDGDRVDPLVNNSTFTMIWENLPQGTRTISYRSNRVTGDLGIRIQIDKICYDLDGDGIPNEKDPDSDGDGCVDAEEAGHSDPDSDGVLGTSPVTVDASGLVTGQGGYTGNNEDVLVETDGCMVEDEDCDGDGIADADDLDNDNDGILDSEECPSAIDVTNSEFGGNSIDVQTNLGNVVTISMGGMVTQPTQSQTTLVGGIEFNAGTGLVNRVEFTFPYEVSSLTIVTRDYDFLNGEINEWMDNFSIVPTRIEGEGVLENGRIDPTAANSLITLFWDGLPAGTTSISWDSHRDAENLGVLFRVDMMCFDQDGDGIPNHKDPDSDGDGCADAIEAGHADGDEDGILGNSPVSVNDFGQVIDQGGYSGNVAAVLDAEDSSACDEVCDEISVSIFALSPATCDNEITEFAFATDPPLEVGFQFEVEGPSTPMIVTTDDGELIQSSGIGAVLESGTYVFRFENPDGCSGEVSIEIPEVVDEDGNPCPQDECEVCPGDVTPPVITCPDDVTITATEFDNLGNSPKSIFNGFESEYRQADASLGTQALVPEGLWAITSDPSSLHSAFADCDDADGDPDGDILVFNGAPETNVAVYCQNVDVVEGVTYNLSVMVASVIDVSPSMIQFAVNGSPIGDIHTASSTTCVWTELAASFTATSSESVRFCVLNQNNAATGNDFALDKFIITTEEGSEVNVGLDLGVASATDDCAEITPTFEDAVEEGECERIVTRTWTAVDPCGNQSSCIQLITVKNDEVTDECAACDTFAIEIGLVTAISGTDQSGEVFGTNTYGLITNNGTGPFSYEWNDGSTGETLELNYSYNPTLGEMNPLNGTVVSLTVVDANGCVTTSTITLDFGNGGDECDCTDTTPPVIEGVEVFIVGECGELSLEELGVSATDNCGEVTITFEDFNFSPSCLGSLQRTYTATDVCGNTSQAVQIIELTNENGPIIECPEDETYECLADVPEAIEPEVSHGCELEVTVEFDETSETNGCTTTITRTWMATDECGGISICTQIITVEDTESPVPPVLEDLAVQCSDDVPTLSEITALDNCSGVVIGTPTEEIVPGDCPNSFTVNRTWTFTDECGNTSITSQVITVNDTEAPVPPVAPANIAVQCADDVPAAEDLMASDNCNGFISGVPTDVVTPGDCPNNFTVDRTWTFTDECGNSSSVTQTIAVSDTEAPVAPESPVDITVQCAADIPAAAELTAEDNCSGSIIGVPTDVVTPGDCPNSFTVERTWTFTDECGNVSTTSRSITVEDTEAPVQPEAPASISVQCAEDVPDAANLIAVDNCSGDIVGEVTEQSVQGDCPNSFIVTRTWTFTDECGNSSSLEQVITVEDTEAPIPNEEPEDISVQCAEDVPEAPVLTASDNCIGVVNSAASEVSTPGDCPNSFIITRTWTFTDECDNFSTVTQIITVADTEAPIPPLAPADLTVQCAEDVPDAEVLTASDNCNGFITGVMSEEQTPGDCPNRFTVERTWTFTDECGNSSSVSQTITVEDTEAPVAPAPPADISVQCAADVPAIAELTAEDNCSGSIVGFPSDEVTPGDCPNSFTIRRTWTFTDECGNASSVTQTIVVEDTEAPIAPEAPGPIAVQCAEDVPAAAALNAQDNCSGTIAGVPTDVVTPGECPNSFTITRTWTFTDDCGNSSGVSQLITVEDTEAPNTPEAPAAISVQCAEDVPTASELFAVDNCNGTISGVPSDVVVPGDCPNSFTITRTWTFTDECGNASSVNQLITVEDTEAPVPPVAPAALSVQCADDVPAAVELTAVDNCTGAITGIPTDEVVPGDCPNTFTVTRTWTFTDECGNSSSVNQTINVEDTQPPSLPAVPAAVTVQCAEDIPGIEELVAEDNCSGSIQGVFSEERIDGDCPNQFELIRTWTFTDECGNSSSASQSITVADSEAPVFSDVPNDMTFQCRDDVGTIVTPTATDNCQEPEVTCETVEDLDECQNGTITVTCTAIDDCGNISMTSYTITINDTTPPELVGVPEDITIDCDDDLPEVPDVQGIDNCGQEVTINFTEIINGGQPIECDLSQPAEPVCHQDENWAMVLFDLPIGEFFSNVETTFAEFADGSATITGRLSDNINPEAGGFDINVILENGMSWEEWSNQSFPTFYKDECGTGNFEEWTYYIISDNSTLSGYGRFAGSELSLTHAPENLFFGYQVGLGANNVNASFGNGGWFIAEGVLVVDGQTFTDIRSAGDFAFDGECCTSYEVERTWTATDCSGNTSEVGTQIITVEEITNFNEDGQELASSEITQIQLSTQVTGNDIAITKLAPNPASGHTSISYILNESMDIQLDIVDMSGNVMHTIFERNVQSGIEHTHALNTERMVSGVYFVRINSGKELILEKLVIAKQ